MKILNSKLKFLSIFVAAFLAFTAVQAQRIAVVDINQLLEEMPAYQKAQDELDRVAAQWRQDIAQEYDEIKSMYNKYQAEQVLMSDEARRQKEEAIMAKEKQVRDLQKERFGPEGSLFRRRQDLVQPIQDKVYRAIEEFANDRGYDFVFDKAGSAGILFANPDYDKTIEVARLID